MARISTRGLILSLSRTYRSTITDSSFNAKIADEYSHGKNLRSATIDHVRCGQPINADLDFIIRAKENLANAVRQGGILPLFQNGLSKKQNGVCHWFPKADAVFMMRLSPLSHNTAPERATAGHIARSHPPAAPHGCRSAPPTRPGTRRFGRRTCRRTDGG